MPGLIVANLLAEEEWSGRTALPNDATRARLSLAATLLSAFGRNPDDELWIPSPIPARVARVAAALPHARIRHDPPGSPPTAVLAWAVTAAIAALPIAQDGGSEPPSAATQIPWLDQLWTMPRPPLATVRRLANRAWTLALAERLDVALPGARWVADEADLAAGLAAGLASGSPTGSWVLKAPWSAAGRQRIVVGPAGPGAGQLRWMRAGFARGDGLLFEPWMPRRADFGCVGLTDASGVRFLGVHRQTVDTLGRFQGLTLWPGCVRPSELPDATLTRPAAARMETVALAVGTALAAEGYSGPFGVDAWCYVDAEGRERFHPLGEVNVRCTMGLVAWAWAWRLGLKADGNAWQLRFGARPAPDKDLFVLAETDGAGAAWMARL